MTEQKMERKAVSRIEFGHEPVDKRIRHFREFTTPLAEKDAVANAAQCLHCGTPYCSASCGLHNRPVDFNRLVREGRWHEAWDALSATNPFPEFTSRVCPALCEAGCTKYLLDGEAVGIKTIERAIVDRAAKAGWITPQPALVSSGKRVAVVGSGPAGLACAQRLARLGHAVTLFEKAAKAGGLLRYGIPDFKLDKGLIDARLEQMKAEGVEVRCSTAVGVKDFEAGIAAGAKDFAQAKKVLEDYDAVVLCCGAEVPRTLSIPGIDAKGVHFALDYLIEQNRVCGGEKKSAAVSAKDCNVYVIGSGDTSNDCVGTARRQGAKVITQSQRSPMPPESVDRASVWPAWPKIFRTASSQEEGCERLYETLPKEILKNAKGEATAVRCVKLVWKTDAATGRRVSEEVPESTFDVPAQRVFLAMGYTGPSAKLLAAFGVSVDKRGNAAADGYRTGGGKVFVCGDARRGQSLVVHALGDGLACAATVDAYLSAT